MTKGTRPPDNVLGMEAESNSVSPCPLNISDSNYNPSSLMLLPETFLCWARLCQSCLTFCSPWTVAHQAPLSMRFSRQEYWSGLPFPSPGDLPNPGMEPRSPALQADSSLSELQGRSSSFLWYFTNVSVRNRKSRVPGAATLHIRGHKLTC